MTIRINTKNNITSHNLKRTHGKRTTQPQNKKNKFNLPIQENNTKNNEIKIKTQRTNAIN